MYSIYIAQIGDTLDSIANKVGISVDALATLNNLEPLYEVQIGDKIVVPVSKSNSIFERYEVKTGDTLYKIAGMFGMNASTLAKINGLKDDEYIYPGNVLLVPRKGVNVYVTDEGDNLGYLSQKLNIPVSRLVGENPNMILAGDQIIIYY